MTVIQAALLGLIQGATEFLPVSSSGHLVLARALMDLREIPVLFDVILHLATLIVVIWVFRARVGALLAAIARFLFRRTREDDAPSLRLALYLIGASALTAVIGFGISELEIRNSPGLVAGLLLVTAGVLLASKGSGGKRNAEDIGWPRALAMGAAQGLGVFPGISRSGITISTGLLSGLDRKSAGEFSFLLSIPAVGGAFLFTLKDAAELSAMVPPLSLTIGFLAALAAGYAALRLLLWLIASGRLWIFAIYLIPVGILGLIRFAMPF